MHEKRTRQESMERAQKRMALKEHRRLRRHRERDKKTEPVEHELMQLQNVYKPIRDKEQTDQEHRKATKYSTITEAQNMRSPVRAHRNSLSECWRRPRWRERHRTRPRRPLHHHRSRPGRPLHPP